MSNMKAVILAAGKGTRMKSELPKVLHTVKGRTMVEYVIDAAKGAGADEICVIVGYKGDMVRESLNTLNVSYAEQAEQLGTGHAVKCAADFIGTDGDTLILCGDTPLITSDTLKKLYERHTENGNAVTVLSAIFEDPFGYGRIIKDSDGNFRAIVEQKDCTEEEAKVQEVNSGMYLFNSELLSQALGMLTNNNAQGEYYLTDTIEIIKGLGGKVEAMPVSNKDEIMGVNTVDQLLTAESLI